MKFEDIKDKTIAWHTGMESYSDEIIFGFTDGSKMKMYHIQDCCENVKVEEIIGDPKDLLDSPLRLAEKVTQDGDVGGTGVGDYSETWTFYKLATLNGYVTIRWLGTSNGYYSEAVTCEWM